MKFKCGSVGQYKFYDVTISGFIEGAELLVFSCAAVIVFDCGLCVNAFSSEYAQPGVYLQMSVRSLVQLSVFTGKCCLENV